LRSSPEDKRFADLSISLERSGLSELRIMVHLDNDLNTAGHLAAFALNNRLSTDVFQGSLVTLRPIS